MKKHSNWFWGIFLLVAGVALVVGQVVGFSQLGFWQIVLCILLLACLVQSLVSRSIVGVTLSLALGYVVLQTPLQLLYISPWLLVLSALLVGGGLSMIFKKKPAGGNVYWGSYNGEQHPPAHGNNPGAIADANDDDNHPYGKVRFSGATRYLHSTALETGFFEVRFGAMAIYLDQAQLAPGGAVLEFDVSFGGVELYIPRSWTVRENFSATIGGVDSNARDAQPDPALPILELRGNINIGGVEIKYI